jgi:hypothetical protein
MRVACPTLLLLIASAAPGQSRPDSIARVADLAQLARLEPGVVGRQFASTDPSGRGEDHGHYLRKNGERFVLAEMEGPGVVARIWSANPAGRLYVTLDGEQEARVACPFADLFDGKSPPFCEPLATRTSGGSVSYFPIPYARSCRIEVGEHPEPRALYYQVQYLAYPKGTPLRTFTRELPEGEVKALAAVQAAFARRKPTPESELEQVGTGTPPEKLRDFVTRDRLGPRARAAGHDPRPPDVRARRLARGPLRRRAGAVDPRAADGRVRPRLRRQHRGLRLDRRTPGGPGYLRLPMPFRKGIRIGLRNLTKQHAFVNVTALVEKGPVDASEGYLHGEFRCQDRLQERTYRWAEIAGRGKLVGIAQAIQGVGSLWYLEGNEIITVDGEKKPSIVGTGAEDFFNGGWYWDRGPFAAPFWGLNQKEEWTSNRTMPWRFFVPDAIPFEKGLVAEIEQGSASQVRDTYYSSVAWWYGEKPDAVRAVTLAEASVPRIWVTAQKGSQPASSLSWQGAAEPRYRLFEEFTPCHRSLDRPLYQAFPATHVESEGAPGSARAVVLPREPEPGLWKAKIEAPHSDRFWIDLRAYDGTNADALDVDGARVGTFQGDASDPGPRSTRSARCRCGEARTSSRSTSRRRASSSRSTRCACARRRPSSGNTGSRPRPPRARRARSRRRSRSRSSTSPPASIPSERAGRRSRSAARASTSRAS